MVKSEFVVIGGSYAGLSAALQLARARRQVTEVDAGQRRNRFVDEADGTAHGFLSRDCVAPGAIDAIAKEHLLRYPNVRWLEGMAEDAKTSEDGRLTFRIGDLPVEADRLVLATGVQDELPEVPGLAERWGRSVFHCPTAMATSWRRGPSESLRLWNSHTTTRSCSPTGARPPFFSTGFTNRLGNTWKVLRVEAQRWRQCPSHASKGWLM